MQSASAILWPDCHCPIPSFLIDFGLSPKFTPSSLPLPLPRRREPYRKLCSLTAPATNNCSKEQLGVSQSNRSGTRSSPHRPHSYSVLDEFHSSAGLTVFVSHNPVDGTESPAERRATVDEFEVGVHTALCTNMWWPDLRAAFGQRISFEGIVSAARVLLRDRHLALPHMAVPDIRYIDWVELRKRGFKGVVFDKDNTITVPYSLALWAPLGPSMEECKSVFGNDIAVFSNSAGLREYDYNGSKARALERAIGIKVVRHRVKKPAGTAEEIENHFGCTSSQLIMVGDRTFTDIVYGNRNDFLTILTKPLSTAEEPFIVRQVRKLEIAILNYWLRRGIKPTAHHLLPDPTECVKDNPLIS
ncbi:unnamed protein product [Linum trigynum]|uniref:Uncharacterized protein n=1 Tax=Linum trigynum TaxID=586398 RepID=A0AAV2F7Z9_9ROSI